MFRLLFIFIFFVAFIQEISAQNNSVGIVTRAGLSQSTTDEAIPYPVFDGGLRYTRLLKNNQFGIGIEALYSERYRNLTVYTIHEDFLALPFYLQYHTVFPATKGELTLLLGMEYNLLISQTKKSLLANDTQQFGLGAYSKTAAFTGIEAGLPLSDNLRLGLGLRFMTDLKLFSNKVENVASTITRNYFMTFSVTRSW